jgi:peptide deformylase
MRPQTVTVKAQNRNGEWFERTCEDIAARAVCHETEHLDGVLFIDKVDKIISDAELNALLAAQDDEEEDKPEAKR